LRRKVESGKVVQVAGDCVIPTTEEARSPRGLPQAVMIFGSTTPLCDRNGIDIPLKISISIKRKADWQPGKESYCSGTYASCFL
jgi:hypothetical protein